MSSPFPRRNPLPQLTPARVRHLQKRITQRLWRESRPVLVKRSDELLTQISVHDAGTLPLVDLRPGEYFGRGGDNWTRFWLRADVPAAKQGEFGERFLRWNCQGETTVWIDQRPWSGLDIGHRECRIPDGETTLWLECCSWQTGVWISMLDPEAIGPHGLRFDGADLAIRDPDAWSCHCDLDVIVQMLDAALALETDLKLAKTIGYCRALESASPRLRRLLVELDTLCDVWQRTENVAELSDSCAAFLKRWPAEHWQPQAAICGHAHIDLVWLWPENATRQKIVHTFASLMRLMDRYPQVTFVQSMPALYRMLEEQSPYLMSEVKRLIKEGRWEVVGAFEVEPDTNLPGGEALARSIAIGQAKIEELTGGISRVAWIPDVFGYSQCLPQIMALGGVEYFYTTKMTWSNVTKFPYTSFVWRGADGTEILSHLGTTDYNGEVQLDVHERAMSEHRQAGEHPELLLPVGYGDGGGGPTEQHVERVTRCSNLSGAARTTWTRIDDFFSRMEQVRDTLPIYQGELYLEYHRGTYTTQSDFKRLYRRAEQSLQTREAVRAALDLPALPDEAWLRVLFAHFHDAIPGSSIREVYAEMNPELEALADHQLAEARRELRIRQATGDSEAESDDDGQSVVSSKTALAFNSLPYERICVVEHDGDVYQAELPPLSSAALQPANEVKQPIREASQTRLRNDRVEACFDDRGALCQLTVDGCALELIGSPQFVISPDDPAAFDAWDIDHHATKIGVPVASRLQLRLVEHSPARAVLQSDRVSIGAASELQVRYILDAASSHLRVEPTVSWRESHRVLRYVVPTSYRGRNARFGCPFGAIERPQLAGTESDEAMWEVPGARWAAVQLDGGIEGLVLLTENKLGFSARDGVLSVSLLRAAKWPDATADLGQHTIRFAVGSLQLQTTDGHLNSSMAADSLFNRPVVYHERKIDPRFRWHDLKTLNASWCAPSRIQEDAYFFRLHETAGRKGVARLELAQSPRSIQLVDFLERTVAELTVDANRMVQVPYRPFQILTVRVCR